MKRKIGYFFGLFFLIQSISCIDVPSNLSKNELLKKGTEYFKKAKKENYSKKYFILSNKYLSAAYKKGAESGHLFFMLGTTYNYVYKDWEKAVFFSDLAKMEYEKKSKVPLEYWKNLYNLSNSLLRISQPKVRVSVSYLKKIISEDIKKYSYYKKSHLDEFKKLKKFAADVLEKIESQP